MLAVLPEKAARARSRDRAREGPPLSCQARVGSQGSVWASPYRTQCWTGREAADRAGLRKLEIRPELRVLEAFRRNMSIAATALGAEYHGRRCPRPGGVAALFVRAGSVAAFRVEADAGLLFTMPSVSWEPYSTVALIDL